MQAEAESTLARQTQDREAAIAEAKADGARQLAERVAALQESHAAKVAALQGDFDELRKQTETDRKDADRLRAEALRLEAALQVARTENERERFLLAYNSGVIFMTAGRYDRAETDFLKALSLREADPAVHFNLGILYDSHLRQPAKARRHYERFLELAPSDRDAPKVMQWLRELP